MDPEQLDDVMAMLQEGNMIREAARRNITQLAFSRRVRGFETWPSVEVVKRGADRIEISEALAANEPVVRP